MELEWNPENPKTEKNAVQLEMTVADDASAQSELSVQDRTATPPPYPGNKYGSDAYIKIINQFPPHINFISAFLGSCAVMREKEPAPGANIGIEVDARTLSHYWKGYTGAKLYNYDFIAAHCSQTKYLLETHHTHELMKLPTTLVYADPPYILDSRRNGKLYYRHELTYNDHFDFIEWCKLQKCMIAISQYPHHLYDSLVEKHGWRKLEYEVMTRAGKATECLYMNYAEPERLHQYNYLGTDSWDRQRIKRKIAREIGKLGNLPPQERNAIIKAINKAYPYGK
ncbi:hypothetical protein [Methylotenera sp.]|uniref:hypothetical protein n=1 Tax=Methylotenera sp. TaxID=2051956 RepID=UPI002ED97A30